MSQFEHSAGGGKEKFIPEPGRALVARSSEQLFRQDWSWTLKAPQHDSRPDPALHAGLTLGRDVVVSNGYDPSDREICFAQNFGGGLRRKGGEPIHLDPTPDCNQTSSLLGVPCVRPGESCLCLPPQPGLIQYYRDIGLVNGRNQLVIVWPEEGFGGPGYPNLDLLTLAASQEVSFAGQYFVSAFTSPHIRQQAARLGLLPVQCSDSFCTNDKQAFRGAENRYGYEVLPGMDLESRADVDRAVERFRDSRVWVKFSHSWGGDMVLPLDPPIDAEMLLRARRQIRREVAKGFLNNDYGEMTFVDYWPEDRFNPEHCRLLIEEDARHSGEMLVNGSAVVTIAHDGTVRVVDYFRQLTSDGVFQGSCSFSQGECFGAEAQAELDRQFHEIGRYAARELRLYGMCGIDFMLLRNERGGPLEAVMIELNGRPPISACSHIVASKLDARHWVSRDVVAAFPVTTFEDFERLVTLGRTSYARGNPEQGLVVPMMMGSLWGRSAEGYPVLLSESNLVKLLVTAASQAACERIIHELTAAGRIGLNAYVNEDGKAKR